MKLKNEQDVEREKYTQLIIENENTIDDLKDEHKKITVTIDMVQEDLQNGYRHLSMLNDEDLYHKDSESIQFQQCNGEQEYFFRRELIKSEELISEEYVQQEKLLEEESEKLYKKRSAISWD